MSDDNPKSEMNILQKIMTAIRNDSRLLSDAVLDSCGTQRFEAEMDRAQCNLNSAKQKMTDVMVKEQQTARIIDIIKSQIVTQEAKIAEALNDNNESAAFQLAQAVVELELDSTMQQQVLQSLLLNLEHLTKQMEQAERQLKDFERQLTMVRTTENVQQATATISKNFAMNDAKLLSAKKSLDRIRAKQQSNDAEIKSEFETSLGSEKLRLEADTTGQLKQSQIEDVLSRIKDRH